MTFPFIPLISLLDECDTGSLTDCDATKYSSATPNCPGQGCNPDMDIEVEWNNTLCDDDCHHIEVWRKVLSGSSCTGGSYSKQVDDLGCTSETGCSTVDDGCWLDSTNYGENGSCLYCETKSFCYQVEIRTDSGDIQEDTCTDYHVEYNDSCSCSQCCFE